MAELGRLEQADLRKQWPDESRDLTPWLATEGLGLLGEAIGADLVVVDQEARVGPFFADILARVEGPEDHLVVIENQLERTDHDHLGKTIVYASGLGARTVIWIARQFREEHRQAVDWLNEHTDGDVSYFALELRLVHIGDSLPAPEFRVVCSPNEWTQTVRKGQQGKLSQEQLQQRQFWVELIEFMEQSGSTLPVNKKPPRGGWSYISLGRAGFNLILKISHAQRLIRCEVEVGGPQAHQSFGRLREEKTKLESELGPLEWRDQFRYPLVGVSTPGSIEESNQRSEVTQWMKSKAEALYAAFAPRIAALQLPQDSE